MSSGALNRIVKHVLGHSGSDCVTCQSVTQFWAGRRRWRRNRAHCGFRYQAERPAKRYWKEGQIPSQFSDTLSLVTGFKYTVSLLSCHPARQLYRRESSRLPGHPVTAVAVRTNDGLYLGYQYVHLRLSFLHICIRRRTSRNFLSFKVSENLEFYYVLDLQEFSQIASILYLQTLHHIYTYISRRKVRVLTHTSAQWNPLIYVNPIPDWIGSGVHFCTRKDKSKNVFPMI